MFHQISTFERTLVTFHDSGTAQHFVTASRGKFSNPMLLYLNEFNLRDRNEAFAKTLRTQLLDYLDPSDLRSLRATSNVLGRVVRERVEIMFRTIYVHAPLPRKGRRVSDLQAVVSCAHHLVITIGGREKSEPSDAARRKSDSSPRRTSNEEAFGMRTQHDPASGAAQSSPAPHAGEATASHRFWLGVFSHAPQLRALTLHIHSPGPWPGRTELEQTILLLRSTLEHPSLRLPHLTQLRLTPVHALGILHLTWLGFSAFARPYDPLKSSVLWTQITTLEMRIPFPVSLTAPQMCLFLAALHGYLRSFASKLRRLSFFWLGSVPGPNPLDLHLHLVSQSEERGLMWPALRALVVGNVASESQTIELARPRAPELKVMRVLGGRGKGGLLEGYKHQAENARRSTGSSVDGDDSSHGLATESSPSWPSDAKERDGESIWPPRASSMYSRGR